MQTFFYKRGKAYKITLYTQRVLGMVYKPKGCLDSPIRFVLQKDNTALLFRLHEWKNKKNPFVYPKLSLLKTFLSFL